MFWNFEPSTGAPTLLALTAGRAAIDMEAEEDNVIVAKALDKLKSVFGEEVVPKPIHTAVTRWRKDEFAKGSYSYIAAGASGNDYEILSKPVWAKWVIEAFVTCWGPAV